MHVTLHNTLGAKTALLFQGQQMPLDRSGAGADTGTTEYTFTADARGHLHLRGRTGAGVGSTRPRADTGTQYQTAMGLHGALVVRPAGGGQAYDADSAYDDEAVLVLSEIDPALNNKRRPVDLRHARLRPALLADQRQGLPGHRSDHQCRRATPSSCAT